MSSGAKQKGETESASEEPEFVVGIGASAGGLEAIERMFDHMPDDTGMAFVLVQHLSPDFKSLMDELLGRWTDMAIVQAADGINIVPNTIYLMPPRRRMVVAQGRLLLVEMEPDDGLMFPIDHFFRSLANEYGYRAISVVLSGTGTDGTRGIGAVHEANGLVIAQREDTAKFNGMPRSALDAGVCDLVLAPEDIPDALINYANHSTRRANHEEHLAPTERETIFGLLNDTFDTEFDLYKPTTVNRRIERRMLLTRSNNLKTYLELLRSSPDELAVLYRDLLIGVTSFFRDSSAYETLTQKALTKLVENASDGGDIRVWVSCCATGEEAYSIAMAFDELIAECGKTVYLKIFATDINSEALEYASRAVYPIERLGGMSEERLSKYFRQVESHFEIEPHIRQMVVFAPHNLLKDPPFTRMDLITCRNFLIYVQPHVQRKILSLFHFGLRTGGVLFLGSSEICELAGDGFDVADSQWKIFTKSREGRVPAGVRHQFFGPNRRADPVTGPESPEVLLSTYDALLGAVMPPSLLVSKDGQLVHVFGDAGRFLQVEQGRQTSDIAERLRPEFRFAASAAMRRAAGEGERITYAGIRGQDSDRLYDLSATRVFDERLKQASFLISIEENTGDVEELPLKIDVNNISAEQVAALESELRHSKENLQSTIEELEASNEELQATNEELIASNEELQTTNEELHSVNEELYTVNAEHQNKISQLSELTRDMDHLLQCTEVHTVFLDSNLAIRKFTPRIADKFNFLPQDVGRRIDDFTHTIACDDLPAKIAGVVKEGQLYQEEVQDCNGSWYLMRILPYHTHFSDSSPRTPTDGAVLTLVDVSRLKEASEALEESVRQRDRFLAMLSHELRNPLGTILNATHLLQLSDDERLAEAIAVIRRQADHMGTLLADLLDVTRVSQGKIQLQKRPFNLLDAIQVAVESVRSRCDAREQSITVEVPQESVWVHGSEPRLLQVVSNLLTNASKYSGQGDTIWLSVKCGDGQVEVRVRDEGVGIPADQIDRVFEMFVQSDRTLDRADGGLGVGLTLVKSLVELHRGTICVTSDGVGQGSEFLFTLPLTDAPATVAHTSEELAGPHAAQQKKVLLVEDSVDAGKMLAFLLEDAGYEVSIASDGRRGWDMIRKDPPHTAVIDIGLPEIDGYQLARMIRRDSAVSGVYLIALTGYGQEADRNEALLAGFDEHLVKPVDPDLLYRLLSGRPGAKDAVD